MAALAEIHLSLEPKGPEEEGNAARTPPRRKETSFGPDLEEEISKKLSLHQAAKNGNEEDVLEILQGWPGDGRVADIDAFDEDGWTALHFAVFYNHLSVIKALLRKGADPEIRTSKERWIPIGRNTDYLIGEGSTALHLAARKSDVMAVRVLLNPSEHLQQYGTEASINLKRANVDAENYYKRTALHIAVERGNVDIVRVLLENGAEPCHADEFGRTPLHQASSTHNVDIVRVFLQSGVQKTALHHPETYRDMKSFIDSAVHHGGEDLKSTFFKGRTPLHWASCLGDVESVSALLEKGAQDLKIINLVDDEGKTAVHVACNYGHVEVLKVLLDKKTTDLRIKDNEGNTPLMCAILAGHADSVKAILIRFHRATTHKLLMTCNNEKTTPIREAIKRMPDAAAMMLDYCTEPGDLFAVNDNFYCLTLYYSVLEDFQDDNSVPEQYIPDHDSSHTSVHEQRYSHVQECAERGFTTTWGPVGFDRKNHPLNLIAQSENLELLKHPLVTYLLKRKWKVTRLVYLIGLLFYCTFLAFLTAFALTAPSPLSESCHAVRGALANASSVGGCELSDNRQRFTFTAAIFVVLLALTRLIIEVFQMYHHDVHYFTDPVNWMELFMAMFAIIFVWVFNTDCLCTYYWQWQIGTIAVLLAWFDFIIFVQKLPTVGIYVAMLRNILWSFIKTLPLAVMLVVAFALGFFMLFSEPGNLRSPFSTPARALVSIVAYTAGDFSYDGLFRLTLGGTEEDSDVEEIPFPPVSYILFIVFVVMMSILLSNLLTALAVGDTEKILQNAEARNIALKIQLSLSVEAILPAKHRRKFIIEKEDVYPNQPTWWRWKLWQSPQNLPRWKRCIRYLLEKYLELRAHVPKGIKISEVLKQEDNSLKSLTKKTHVLMKDTQELKKCQKDMKQAIATMQEDMVAIKNLLEKLVANKEQKQEAAGESDSSSRWI